MPSKRKGQEPTPQRSTPLSYAAWKSAAVAELSGPVAVMERQWRQLFVKGKSPADAAREIESHHRPAFRAR